jgi:hypothetical protein
LTKVDGGGRVELSLLRFAAANPKWVPNASQKKFLRSVERAMKELREGTLGKRQIRASAGGGGEMSEPFRNRGNWETSPLLLSPVQQLSLLHGVRDFRKFRAVFVPQITDGN